MLMRSYIGQAVLLLVATENLADAARLWGAIHATSLAGVPDAERLLADIHARLARSLSAPALDRLVREGERLTLEQSAALAERELERCSRDA